MRGIVIGSSRDIFKGSAIDVAWFDTPGAAAVHVGGEAAVHSGAAPVDFVLDLDFREAPGRLTDLEKLPAPLILLNAVSTPLHALDAGERFARINGWNTFLERPLAEVVCHPSQIARMQALCAAWGKTLEALPDLPGMPSARIVSMIVNEAYFALGEGVSTKEAIDTAMRLGTNYPFGPFEWSERIGLAPIVALLEALGKNDPIYTIAPKLREEAHGPIA